MAVRGCNRAQVGAEALLGRSCPRLLSGILFLFLLGLPDPILDLPTTLSRNLIVLIW